MAADIGAVLAVVAAHGDRLRYSVDFGLTVIGSVLGSTVSGREHDGWLVRGARRRRISGL